MADFGWAFVKGSLLTGSAPPSGAVQFNDGNNKLAASGDLVFISGSTSQLNPIISKASLPLIVTIFAILIYQKDNLKKIFQND